MLAMVVLDIDARIGRIISIDGRYDKVCILYPRFAVNLHRDEVRKLNLRTGNLFALTMKNPAWHYEGYNKDTMYPIIQIKGKVTGFSLSETGRKPWHPTIYINVHCALEALPPQGESTIMLRLGHTKSLNLKKDDMFLISISDKYSVPA